MIVKYKHSNRKLFVTKFFDVLDAMQLDPRNKLTQAEREILLEFLFLPPKFKYYRFSAEGKKAVIRSATEKGNKYGMTNVYILLNRLVQKGILKRDEDGVIYLQPSIERGIEQGWQKIQQEGKFEITFRFEYDYGTQKQE